MFRSIVYPHTMQTYASFAHLNYLANKIGFVMQTYAKFLLLDRDSKKHLAEKKNPSEIGHEGSP